MWTLILCLPLLMQDASLENGGFESKPGRDDPVPGWTVDVGARNGAQEPLSEVSLDGGVRHDGRASLRLSGDDTTRAWRILKQEIPARRGGNYHLSAWLKAEDVRQERIRGTSIQQFANAYVALLLFDASGQVVGKRYGMPQLPTSDWKEVTVDLRAPEGTRRAEVYLFLSMSGTLWIDELSLEIEGGEAPPEPERVFFEDFERSSRIPREWKEEVGARNGSGLRRSKIQIDREGAEGRKRSLKLSGDARTIQWLGLERRIEAAPGERFQLTAQAKAEDVRAEGIQFQNLHARIVFLDGEGEPVGPAQYAHPGTGTYDWRPIEVSAVSPLGTEEVLIGLFLSMSGSAWFDEIELTREAGAKPAYHDWRTLETDHLILRYPPDHPGAQDMAAWGRRFESAFEAIQKALEVKYDERITLYLYRDNEQGRELTGRDLDFAAPEARAVHQRPNSTIGHEMVHVIALKIGTAQTGLLGEGIGVWLDGRPAEYHHDVAKELLEKGELPSVGEMLDDFRKLEKGYPAAGSFCGFLIERFGIDRFKELYPMKDPAAAAEEVLGRSFEEVEREWRVFLR